MYQLRNRTLNVISMKPKWGLSPYMLINLSCTLNMLRYISSKIKGTKIYIQLSLCMIMYVELKVKQMFFYRQIKGLSYH